MCANVHASIASYTIILFCMMVNVLTLTSCVYACVASNSYTEILCFVFHDILRICNTVKLLLAFASLDLQDDDSAKLDIQLELQQKTSLRL